MDLGLCGPSAYLALGLFGPGLIWTQAYLDPGPFGPGLAYLGPGLLDLGIFGPRSMGPGARRVAPIVCGAVAL